MKVRVRGDKKEYVLDGIKEGMTPFDILTKLAHDSHNISKYGCALQTLTIHQVTFHPVDSVDPFHRDNQLKTLGDIMEADEKSFYGIFMWGLEIIPSSNWLRYGDDMKF